MTNTIICQLHFESLCIHKYKMKIEYITSIPPIPESLIESYDEILKDQLPGVYYDDDGNWHPPGTPGATPRTTAKGLPDNLRKWLDENVPFPIEQFQCVYLLIYPGHVKHVDYPKDDPLRREMIVNYVVRNGGENAVSHVYDDDGNEVQSIRIEEKKWIKLPTMIPHCVDGITDPPRILIRVTPKDTRWEDIK